MYSHSNLILTKVCMIGTTFMCLKRGSYSLIIQRLTNNPSFSSLIVVWYVNRRFGLTSMFKMRELFHTVFHREVSLVCFYFNWNG